jgi:hypothetical protein
MSDQTIDQLYAYLKGLHVRIKELGRAVNRLEILAYRFKRLSYEIDQIDIVAFEIRQEFDKVREVCKRSTSIKL